MWLLFFYLVLTAFTETWTALLNAVDSVEMEASNQCNDPKFRLASYYASNMVIQRAPVRPRIWGYASSIGDQITAELNNGEQKVVVDAFQGKEPRVIWEALFEPITAAGPHIITVKSRTCLITLVNILVGDVWICSGQSNMEIKLREINKAEADMNDAVNFPNVRIFYTSQLSSRDRFNDVKSIRSNWASPSNNNVAEFSAICWFFGRNLFKKYKRPIGLIQSTVYGTRIETWMSTEALSKCPHANAQPRGFMWAKNEASGYYNAMINPFIHMPIYGMIWYQGESNIASAFGNQDIYSCLLKSMVADLRSKWHSRSPEMNDKFPFGEVQLSPWRNRTIVEGFPDIRWAQTDSYGYIPNKNMTNCFMAVAIDLPDFASPIGDIHPRYKRQIADRLSLAAYNVAYGSTDAGLYQGPLPTSISIDGALVHVTYSTKLVYRTTKPNNFELCCGATSNSTCTSGGRWVGTLPVNRKSQEVDLKNSCNIAESITGFRYLWRESPCDLQDCPIYSIENNLPAPPYIYNGIIKPGPGRLLTSTDGMQKRSLFATYLFLAAVFLLTPMILWRLYKKCIAKLNE